MYFKTVLKDNPVAAYRLDTFSSNFADSSGNAHHASRSATTVDSRPIAAKGRGGQKLNSSTNITYPVSDVMISGKQRRGFSLEILFREIVTGGTSWMFKRDVSGISLVGNTLTFTLTMGTTASITYEGIEVGENYHIVGTYDTQHMLLYVNGVNVGSAEIDPSMLTTGFSSDTTSSMVTSSSSTAQFAIDKPAIYNYALNQAQITRHYNAATNYPDAVNQAVSNGGSVFELSDPNTDNKTFNLDWDQGTFSGFVANVDGNLANLYDATNSNFGAGTWQIDIPFEGDTTIYQGSIIRWHGLYGASDFTVSVSTDQTTFTTVSNFSQPLTAFNTASDPSITVKVTFSAQTNQTLISSMQLVLYVDKDIKCSNEIMNSSTLSNTSVLSPYSYPPASFNAAGGALFTGPSSGLSIPPDTDFGSINACEMTLFVPAVQNNMQIFIGNTASIKINSSGQFTYTGLSALYLNGASVASPFSLNLNVWNHLIAIFTSAATGNVYLANTSAGNAGLTCRVGFLALYNRTFTAAQAANIYNAIVGIPGITQTDTAPTIADKPYTDTLVGASAYAYDWSITGAG